MLQGLVQGVNLRPGDLHFRFADLGEIPRRHITCEQTDDDDHHQEIK